MGNNTSSASGEEPRPNAAAAALRNFLKPGSNSLGITKAELDERCRPSGLYSDCQWEEKTIRRLIGDGKLAARLQGTEERNSCSDRECPICFLNYAEINVTKCCQANLCTECYLQVKPQKPQAKHNGKPQQNNCPFCNNSRLLVTVAGKLDSRPVEQRLNEEQQLNTGAQIGANSSLEDESASAVQHQEPEGNPKGLASTPPLPNTGFGSSLEQNERVALMRARSSSMASENSANAHHNPSVQEIVDVAMTPEERHALEEEMRAQHHHPLTMRLEQEEAERRMRNELEYYQRAHSSRRSIRDVRGGGGNVSSSLTSNWQSGRPNQLRLGGSAIVPPFSTITSGRDWNVNRISSSGGAGQNMDDLVVLEAALMLSMDEQARRTRERMPDVAAINHRASGGSSPFGSLPEPLRQSLPRESVPAVLRGLSERMMSEEQQIALAIEESLRESAAGSSSAG